MARRHACRFSVPLPLRCLAWQAGFRADRKLVKYTSAVNKKYKRWNFCPECGHSGWLRTFRMG
jgi:hypothetical protein